MIGAEAHAALIAVRTRHPELQVTVDLQAQTVSWTGQTPITFPIDPFARTCLLEGVDELGYLQKFTAQAEAYEAAHA